MPRYAIETTVSVEKSRAEIESLLIRYRAAAFTSGWREGEAFVAFKLKGLVIRFNLPIPDRKEKRFWWKTVRGFDKKLTEQQAEKNWDQEVRSRWRALTLVVKAKLEAVECGISTLEREFLAFVVLPDDTLLGDWIVTHALPAVRDGRMPLALAGRRDDAPVTDAEVVGASP